MADLLFEENSSEFDDEQQQQKTSNEASGGGGGRAAAGDEDTELRDDPELESIRQKVREMEAEAERLRMMQSDMEKPMAGSSVAMPTAVLTDEERLDTDSRSVYVGNVDYGATAEELETHFHSCGAINRITILCNKYTGQPKGFAYVEFAEKDSVEAALALDESLFRNRSLKVMAKRTNTPACLLLTGRRGADSAVAWPECTAGPVWRPGEVADS
uniref:RRM domain-containing protein n=1 Tax=Macrostomum lignano TaxID=282301 RepID=A0A1I8I6S0_9PLAT